MEEEVITPEEEVFDYHKLRYILTSDGYIFHASFGGLVVCDLGECTEYNGEVPEGYSTIEEWHDGEIDKLNAWKIVEGNLVFDENKYNELQELCEIQEEENSNASHKWVREQLGKTTDIIIDELSNKVNGTSLIVLEDSGDYEIPEVVVSSETIEKVNVVSSNKNLLGVDVVTQTLNGIEFTIEEDGSINLNGTSTSEIELTLKGTSTSLDMLFLIQQDRDYVVSGLVNGVSLNLYNFDGTDRNLIGNYNNEVINSSNSNIVTQTTLKIVSGTSFENVVITPQIEVGSEATTFIKHQETKGEIILYNGEGTINTLNSYYPLTMIMSDENVTIDVTYFQYKSISKQLSKIETTTDQINLSVTTTINDLNQFKTDVEKENNIINSSITEINETLEEGVSKVKNTLVTIDVDGISVATNTSAISTLITNDSFKIMNYDTVLAQFNNDGAALDNLTVRNYFVAGYHRTEKYIDENTNKKRTGVFYVGGDE